MIGTIRSDSYGKLGYMRETPVESGATHEIIYVMSKNASSDFDESQKPDNPQEMLKSNFYKHFNSSSTTTR